MELTDAQKQEILAAEAEVLEVLKKHGCHLEGLAVLRPGNVDVQIIVAINLPAPDAPAPAEAPAFVTPPVNATPAPEAAPAAPAAPTLPVEDTLAA